MSKKTRLIPLGVGGLVEDIGCHILDLLRVEAAAEGRHGILAVRHLVEMER